MAYLVPDNLKSRNDVAAAIRKTVSAFQVSLDDSSTVWYEPLYDPTGEKPHLVVLHPDRGIVVLEVMDTKGGGLLGALRGGLRLVRDGREVEVANPLVRADLLASSLRTRVKDEARLQDANVRVAACAAFPHLSVEEARGKGLERLIPLEKCLFRGDIDSGISGTGEASLLRVFTRLLGGEIRDRIPEEKEKLLRGLIQPETVIDRVASSGSDVQITIFRPPEGEDDTIRVMDRHQEAMAKSLGDGHRVIRGVAGSGKTLVLVCRARLLAKLWPRQDFLVTCYTRSLAGELRQALRESGNVTVMHLDRLMAELIRAAGLKHPGYKDDPSGDKVAGVALLALSRLHNPRYRAVLLDEAQDLGTNALKFVVGLLAPGHDDLVIVADAAQNIFRRNFSWKQAGIQAQGRTRILRINYRNTKEILEFANHFLMAGGRLRSDPVPDPEDPFTVIPPESAKRSGPRPTLMLGKTLEDEVRIAIQQAQAWAAGTARPRSLAVLYPGSDSGKDRAELLNEGLRRAGVRVYYLSDKNNPDAKDRLAQSDAPVVLSTIHSAKGLEFPHVVLCGVWRSDQDIDDNRKLAYVGMTRATDHLAVVTRGGHPLLEDLQRALA